MPRYRKIDPRIWNDEKFASLRDDAQLAFLFVLTHPLMTSLGALRGSPEGLAGERYGWTPEKKDLREGFREAFGELARKGLLKIDPKGLIFVPNFLKYNRPESPNVIKAWKGALDLLPECPLLEETLKRAEACVCAMSKAYAEAFREAFAEELEKPSSKAMPNPEQEQEQEPEQEKEVVGVAPAKAQTKREPIVVFPETLPDEWRQDALKVRKDIAPERVFLKLRGRYAPTSSKKTLGSWRRIFLEWVGREYADNVRTKAATPAHKDPAFKFTDDYYADSVNPDGTTNWGF